MTSERQNISVEGIVAVRNKQPYIVLTLDDASAQLTVAAARNIANDILVQAARIEADAMMVKFFDRVDFPEGALAAIMLEFRKFRAELDREPIETFMSEPMHGPIKGPTQ